MNSGRILIFFAIAAGIGFAIAAGGSDLAVGVAIGAGAVAAMTAASRSDSCGQRPIESQ